MQTIPKEDGEQLTVTIQTNDAVERWFLLQLMKHGATVTIESGVSWASITLASRTTEEAELAAIDKLLE